MATRSRVVAVIGLGSLTALVVCVGFATSLLDGLSAQADDLLQPGTVSGGEVLVVGIDRETLAAVGLPWPWPRTVHAELLDAIGAQGPSLVVYDVLFADERPGDARLADAMRRVPTVLASALALRADAGAPPVVVDDVGPNETLRSAAAGVGHANVALSRQQGVVRALPFYAVNDRGIVVPSLTAAAFAVTEGVSAFVERDDGLQIGGRLVPLDDARLRINYADDLTSDTTVIPAVDILDGSADAGDLRGKIVLVGVTEPTFGDLHLVPNDKSGSVSGVLVHANAINTVASRSWVEPAGTARQMLLLAAVSLLTVAAFVVLRLRWAIVTAAVLIVSSIAWSSWRFSADGVIWDLIWPVLAVGLAASISILWRYFTEYRHRRRAQQLFAEYVPHDVVDLLSDPRALARATAGMRVEVSLLFCDLRGFTPIAATLDPPDVRRLLDHYYRYVSDIVQHHDGTVMQFVGDEVFAVFGAPIESSTSAADAQAVATEVIERVGDLDETLDRSGLPRLTFGIGLHRGTVVAAHVGTSAHRQYSVIGDPVNVGSRLCSQAQAGEVIASPAALADKDNHGFEAAGEVTLKGVAQPMTLFRYPATRRHDQDDRTISIV